MANEGPSRTFFAADPAIGLIAGAVGGLLASVIGVGADIVLYGILVLLYHTDVKVAIPTSVILMASTSLIGDSVFGDGGGVVARQPGLDRRCVPVLVGRGPLSWRSAGRSAAWSRVVLRRITMSAVAVLCLSQYGWTCYHEHIVGWSLVLAASGVIVMNLALHRLFVFGQRSLPLEV